MKIEEVPFPNTEETITDRLTEKAPPEPTGPPEWVSETYPRGDHVITSEVPTEEDGMIQTAIQEKPDKSLKARRFLELVQSGMKPGDAAQKMGGTVAQFASGAELRLKLKRLIEHSRLPAEVRKEMVRSGLNSIFLRNIDGKMKEQKIALDAAKQMAKDPEVGLVVNQPAVAVNIDIGKLDHMIRKLKPIEGLEEITILPEDKREKE